MVHHPQRSYAADNQFSAASAAAWTKPATADTKAVAAVAVALHNLLAHHILPSDSAANPYTPSDTDCFEASPYTDSGVGNPSHFQLD